MYDLNAKIAKWSELELPGLETSLLAVSSPFIIAMDSTCFLFFGGPRYNYSTEEGAYLYNLETKKLRFYEDRHYQLRVSGSNPLFRSARNTQVLCFAHVFMSQDKPCLFRFELPQTDKAPLNIYER